MGTEWSAVCKRDYCQQGGEKWKPSMIIFFYSNVNLQNVVVLTYISSTYITWKVSWEKPFQIDFYSTPLLSTLSLRIRRIGSELNFYIRGARLEIAFRSPPFIKLLRNVFAQIQKSNRRCAPRALGKRINSTDLDSFKKRQRMRFPFTFISYILLQLYGNMTTFGFFDTPLWLLYSSTEKLVSHFRKIHKQKPQISCH